MSTATVIRTAAQQHYSSRDVDRYNANIERAANEIDANPANFEQALRNAMPYGYSVPASVVSAVREHLDGSANVEAAPAATTSETVVPFLTDEQVALVKEAARRGGINETRAVELLTEVGLVAQPEPEPEPEPEDDASLLQRLVSWAKGQGFN